MKLTHKIFIALAFFVLSAGVTNAQTPIVPRLTDKSIKVDIPEYTSVSPFVRDNLIQIESNGKIAYINLKGEYIYGFDLKLQPITNKTASLFDCAASVMAPQEGSYSLQPAILCQQGRMLQLGKNYNKISDFCAGIAAAVKPDPNKYGASYLVYLNAAGKEVWPTLHRKIESSFTLKLQVSPLCEGMRAFFDATLEKWGYADKDGKVVIQPKYSAAMPFSEGLATVCLQDGKYGEKKWGFIDKTGKEVIPCTYKLQPGSFSDGFAVLYTGEEIWDSKAVFIDKTGKICSPEYNVCNSFFGGFAYVSNKYGKAMVIDKNFNVIKTIDFPTDQLTNDALKISEKRPFGLEFVNGLAAAGYFDEIPNGNLYTNDGNILFEKDGRNTIYNFYDGKYALCRYKIDGKEIYGFINKQSEFIIYFEQKSGFNHTTPKPQNAGCELCTKSTPGTEPGTTPEIKPELAPEPEIPCEVCNKQSVCYDEYNCCDDCNPKSRCYNVCNKAGKCYNEYECCDKCNPKSKCYDEYNCCDETNPKSRCYEAGPCPTFDCDPISLPPPPPPPCDYCKYGSGCYSPYFAFCSSSSKCYDPNSVCDPKSICYNKMLCCLKTHGNIWCKDDENPKCPSCDPKCKDYNPCDSKCKDFNPNDPKCKQETQTQGGGYTPPKPPDQPCHVCQQSCKDYNPALCLQWICENFPTDCFFPQEENPIPDEAIGNPDYDICQIYPPVCKQIEAVCQKNPALCKIITGGEPPAQVAPDAVRNDTVNYRMYSAKITLDKVAAYLQIAGDKNQGKQFTPYNMPATVFMAISDKDGIINTPYNETAHGLIWVVTESGMPGRPENDFASYWMAPYTIFSLTSNEIGFGAGIIFGVERNYEERSVSAQSREAGKAFANLSKLLTDPLSLFIDEGLMEDPATPQKANYKINDDGSLLLTSSSLPIFNNLLLTPYFPDSSVMVYKGSLGYVLHHSGRKTDREGAIKMGPEFDKALQKKYLNLKGKFGKK